MDKRERGTVSKERLVVEGISALYTGTQDPAIQQLIQKTRDILTNEGDVGADGRVADASIEGFLLYDVTNDPIKRHEFLVRALNHAKGVLIGQKKLPERDDKLRIVSDRLSQLSPANTK